MKLSLKHSYFSCFSGSYRECFSRSYKLGIRSRPIKVTEKCELQRTQRDPTSSIRACLCTTSNCNILDAEKAEFTNIESQPSPETKVVGKIFQTFIMQSNLFSLSSTKAHHFCTSISIWTHSDSYDNEVFKFWQNDSVCTSIGTDSIVYIDFLLILIS